MHAHAPVFFSARHVMLAMASRSMRELYPEHNVLSQFDSQWKFDQDVQQVQQRFGPSKLSRPSEHQEVQQLMAGNNANDEWESSRP